MTLADTQPHDTAHDSTSSSDAGENALAAKILLTVLIALVAWGLAVFKWGVPGLYIPALALVPVMYVLLITMAKG